MSTHHDTRYVHVSTHYDTVSKRDDTSLCHKIVSTHVSVACLIDMGSLWRWMKRLGFEYNRVSKVSTPLDSVSFMAQRAKYFEKLDEIRSNGSLIFYHDETWANSGEEKRMTWFDPNTGSGRLRNNDTRGKTYC